MADQYWQDRFDYRISDEDHEMLAIETFNDFTTFQSFLTNVQYYEKAPFGAQVAVFDSGTITISYTARARSLPEGFRGRRVVASVLMQESEEEEDGEAEAGVPMDGVGIQTGGEAAGPAGPGGEEEEDGEAEDGVLIDGVGIQTAGEAAGPAGPAGVDEDGTYTANPPPASVLVPKSVMQRWSKHPALDWKYVGGSRWCHGTKPPPRKGRKPAAKKSAAKKTAASGYPTIPV